MSCSTSCACENNISEDITLSSVQAMNLFRVFQEIINNALKHSEASEIKIMFSTRNNKVQFQITDNGIGFNTENYEAGNGLSNIKTRISDINGSCEVTSKENEGTSYKINIPV